MTIKNCFKNHVRGFIKQSIVDKTNVMCPFCVGHHVNVHSDVLVASIMTDARKKKFTPQLPLLCMATKNGFNRYRISD